MRLDLFLKITGVVKRRTKGNMMIKQGFVYVNGLPSKPSKEIEIGDVIQIKDKRFIVKDIPVSKKLEKDITSYIEYI